MQRLLALLTWLAYPVYAWQGLGVRRRTTRMLPAHGPVMHEIAGAAPAISLLVLGDSSAASVGIEQSEYGLAAQLAGLTAERTGSTVRWRAAGFNSATSGQIRDHVLPNLSADPWMHIVLAIGTNDTKNFHSVPRFKKEFGGLLYALRAKWPEARVVWSPVLEFTRAPAMPPLLGKILEIRATQMNRMGVRLCNERGGVPAARLPIDDPAAGFASDGFHASEAGYRAWAEHLLDFVLGNESPQKAC
ncbi:MULTISPECIES: SGNH/GDSL hydrolase family protein [unclassified Mesorhizobium]|uniref:SGNH/GDSL hydrolase family protein n=1 Tax=unclassified Mesorhizobium TaxID=325217 RepID=UPI000F7652D0|nr:MULTISPECIES: SGNH/GDSL hydrolase family protein [unclassified Mesorhizobium]TGT63742.1 SGNH/GDSL hydrolase family protein [Mesorhizobium sp. M00.F.Ca.ET.170.01.1.1]AZO11183.1 SGNH/GDSL hydrolase family protein [Mesorhizobium sp. M3A.F.Ca.ET.080.04.2.1]RWB76529.1 MAG: SGNH/GDSL hydrolase family protein [Mesorhizobium sp.]RWB92294.1 MAG: SGNH/GDSL hydrolase family protein [Mesorhizobium sp.]RWE27895.1 MAG: SGNH/GDSL hydrolase family protein [Mesorhizobium sp.]